MASFAEFLGKHWLIFLAITVMLFGLGYFGLRPENLVTESCNMERFTCRQATLSGDELKLTLENKEEGVMVRKIQATSSDISCEARPEEGWQGFFFGRHIAKGESVTIKLRCASQTLAPGGVRFAIETEWYADTQSETNAKTSKGEAFVQNPATSFK